ncbi:MAG: hypothetical protein FVQ84_08640 [Planctomycetes bacterium]|nr:hypothetical protein [Planctomycetota bacterium]
MKWALIDAFQEKYLRFRDGKEEKEFLMKAHRKALGVEAETCVTIILLRTRIYYKLQYEGFKLADADLSKSFMQNYNAIMLLKNNLDGCTDGLKQSCYELIECENKTPIDLDERRRKSEILQERIKKHEMKLEEMKQRLDNKSATKKSIHKKYIFRKLKKTKKCGANN